MAENDNQEQENTDFTSQLKILLSTEGVSDVTASLKEISKYGGDSLNDIEKLKNKYGSLDNALKSIVKRHKERAAAASWAAKNEQSNIQKLQKGYKSLQNDVRGYSSEITSAAKKMIMPAGLGSAISTTLEYNKSLLVASSSVNRLGLGLGYLQTSLERISRETSLTRQETVQLFDKYQESMRFVSLQKFEGMLKRIQSIVGANAQEIGKMQAGIAAVSQEYPDLAMGLANLKKAGSGLAASEKAVLQERVRNLYFIGKIGDAQYKQLAAYISGNQQVIGADKERQQTMADQIEAANRFKQQWEKASMAIGRSLLPAVQELASVLKTIQEYTKNWDISLGHIVGAYAAIKVGSGTLSALGGMVGGGISKGVGKAAGGMWGGSAISSIGKLFGKKGDKVGKAISGAGGGGVLSSIAGATPVKVVNFQDMYLMRSVSRQKGGMEQLTQKLYGSEEETSTIPDISKDGFGSRVKGRIPGALGKAGLGAAAIGASYLGKWGGKELEESGYSKLGGAVSTGSSLVGIGGAAMSTAAIGSLFGPIGTAAGAIIGTVGGVISEWDNISVGFKKMMGIVSADKKSEERPFKDLSETEKKAKAKLEEDRTYQKGVLEAKEKDIASLGEKGVAQLYGEISDSVATARKELETAREDVDKIIATEFKKTDFGDIDINLSGKALTKNIQDAIDDQEALIAALKKEIDIREADDYGGTDAGKKQRKEEQDALKIQEKILKKKQKFITSTEEGNEALQSRTRELDKHKSRLDDIVVLMAKQKDVAEALSGLYQSQVGNIDAIIERMSITGDIDMDKIFKGIDKALVTLNAEIAAQKKLYNILGMTNNVEKKAAAEKASKEKDISEAIKATYEELAMVGAEGLDQNITLTKQEDILKRINSLTQERTELAGKAGNAYEHTLKLIQSQATGVELLVQLADNYAIGVGASVKLRMQEFNMQGSIISVLKKQFKAQQTAYILDAQSGKENLVLKRQMQDTHNEMVQAQIKQASLVKSMRDAWVSAISAMNTGMGGFTEIIMNAETNTAQIQQLDGAVRSSVSGAYSARDAFGRVIEDVGFAGSEVMNQFGDIVGRGGRQLYETAYTTPMDKRMGISRETGGVREVMEGAARGEARSMIDGIVSAAEHVYDSGNLEALVAGSNEIVKGVFAGQSSFEKDIVSKDKKKGYPVDDTVQSYKTAPPKGSGDWTEAMQEAPRDTLPRLIVNQKSDAVPVFVVNLKDISSLEQGTSITEKSVKKAAEKEDSVKKDVDDKVKDIKKEEYIIKQLKKTLSTLEQSKERKKQEGVAQISIKQEIGDLKNEISRREQKLKDYKSDKTGDKKTIKDGSSTISKSPISSVVASIEDSVSFKNISKKYRKEQIQAEHQAERHSRKGQLQAQKGQLQDQQKQYQEQIDALWVKNKETWDLYAAARKSTTTSPGRQYLRKDFNKLHQKGMETQSEIDKMRSDDEKRTKKELEFGRTDFGSTGIGGGGVGVYDSAKDVEKLETGIEKLKQDPDYQYMITGKKLKKARQSKDPEKLKKVEFATKPFGGLSSFRHGGDVKRIKRGEGIQQDIVTDEKKLKSMNRRRLERQAENQTKTVPQRRALMEENKAALAVFSNVKRFEDSIGSSISIDSYDKIYDASLGVQQNLHAGYLLVYEDIQKKSDNVKKLIKESQKQEKEIDSKIKQSDADINRFAKTSTEQEGKNQFIPKDYDKLLGDMENEGKNLMDQMAEKHDMIMEFEKVEDKLLKKRMLTGSMESAIWKGQDMIYEERDALELKRQELSGEYHKLKKEKEDKEMDESSLTNRFMSDIHPAERVGPTVEAAESIHPTATGELGGVGASLFSSALAPLGPLGAIIGAIPSVLKGSSNASSAFSKKGDMGSSFYDILEDEKSKKVSLTSKFMPDIYKRVGPTVEASKSISEIEGMSSAGAGTMTDGASTVTESSSPSPTESPSFVSTSESDVPSINNIILALKDVDINVNIENMDEFIIRAKKETSKALVDAINQYGDAGTSK